MRIFGSPQVRRKYLLIPAMPTPNGRLHLGHMGGPFLKMDILARLYRRNGHQAEVMSASDVYESYTLMKSFRTHLPVKTVCNDFHELIVKDLSAMMVECSHYFNPLEETFRTTVDDTYRDTLEKITAAGAVVKRTEKVLYSPSADKYIVGTWLKGKCPHCHSDAGSYLCEACGMQFNPEDVLEPAAVTGETDLEEVTVDSFFLKITQPEALIAHIQKMGVPDINLEIVQRYLTHYNNEVRLTNPGKWGVKWQDDIWRGENYNVVFPYSGLLSLSRVCGGLYPGGQHPFSKDSDVITIASFGIDSTIPWFAGVLGSCLATDELKPFDYFLTNHFYRLEGSKFSTSRLHAIWAADIVNKTKASVDAVRYYLTKNNPEFEEKDFFVQDFISLNNHFLVERLNNQIEKCWHYLEPAEVQPISDSLLRALEAALETQSAYLEPPRQQLAESLTVFDSWVKRLTDKNIWKQQPYWALKSIALLAYPVMPKMSQALWTALSAAGAPSLEGFLAIEPVVKNASLPRFFEVLTYEDLLPCLPATLTQATTQSQTSSKILLDFMEPEVEAGIMEVREVNLINNDERIAPFKASRFEVYPGQQSPLDIHEVRECWFVSQGKGEVIYNGTEVVPVSSGDVLYFESNQSHQVTNTGEDQLIIFSVWWKE
ncbi:class I tRNA ligase family protein [Chitinophaga flava]|nr:class I tRNA ligase family protein [Chitinophaga flava]